MKFLTRSIQRRRLSKLLKSMANDDSSALKKIYDDYAAAILIHCKNVHLSNQRTSEILDTVKLAKFIDNVWREIALEAVRNETKQD